MIDGGRVVVEGTPADLKARVAGSRLDLVLADPAAFDRAIHQLNGRVVTTDPSLRTVGVGVDGSADAVRGVLGELQGAAIDVETVAISSATLDDVFLALTGHHAQPEVASYV